MVHAVLFDLDDTLIRTRESKWEAIQYTGKTFYHIDISEETLRKHWGIPYREFMGTVFGPVDSIEGVVKNYESIRDRFPVTAYPDAVSTVQSLCQRYPVGIVSSASKTHVLSDLRLVSFPVESFVYIQGQEDTTVHKPNPHVFDPILGILEKRGIMRVHTVFIGDAVVDCDAATGAGLHFIGIYGHTTQKVVFDQKGVLSVASVSEIPQILATL